MVTLTTFEDGSATYADQQTYSVDGKKLTICTGKQEQTAIFEFNGGLLVLIAIVWGFLVISDSPQFSALAAELCPPRYTGTALTVQNGIGFAITVLSIQVTAWLAQTVGWKWAFMGLSVGPLFGVFSLFRLRHPQKMGSP